MPRLFFCLFADPEVTRYYDFDPFNSVEQARDPIARQRARFEERESIRWGITYPANDIVIGTIGLHLKHHNAQGGLGYDLVSSFW